MMTLQQALAYGRSIGVRYHIINRNGAIFGGYATREAAEHGKRRLEREWRQSLVIVEVLNGDEREITPQTAQKRA